MAANGSDGAAGPSSTPAQTPCSLGRVAQAGNGNSTASGTGISGWETNIVPGLAISLEALYTHAAKLRPVELGRYFGQKIDDGRIHVWIRTASKLSDDPALHMCALAYASDFSLLDAAMARYGRTLFDKRMMPASLDHAMWFHRPFRADEWLLYAQDSPSARGGRGLTRGMIFKQDGTLVASVAQEGSLRQRK